MRTPKRSVVKTEFKCGRCSMLYYEYKHLLEHLYWRHGTESVWCNKCSLKRWNYAVHKCHVLPLNNNEVFDDHVLNTEDRSICTERETEFCFCRKFITDAPMIGCDGPNCALEWYHFSCVGISTPPDGDWICPNCVKEENMSQIDAGCTETQS